VVFVFLIIVRPQDFVRPLVGLPLVTLAMVILAIGFILTPARKKLLKTSSDKFIAFFFLAMIASTIAVHWVSYTVQIVVSTLQMAVAYYLVVNLANNEGRIKTMTWVLVTCLTIVAGMGVLQYYGWDITGNGMFWAADKGVWQIRGIGIFDNPNDLAYSVVMVIPFALGLLFRSKGISRRILSLIFLGIVAYAIWLTRSRGGLLCLVLSTILWLYLFLEKKTFRRIVAAVGIIVVIGAVVAVAGGYKQDESSMERLEAWSAGMDMLKTHPLVGVGKDQFIEHHYRDSHSSFIRSAAELGLIGLYAWLGVIYCSLISLRWIMRRGAPPEWKGYATGYAVYIPIYLTASVFSTRTYDIVFLLVIALVSASERLFSAQTLGAREAPKRVKIFNKNIGLLTVGVLVVLKLFLMHAW